MLISTSELEPGSRLEGDVVIAGAGMAGIVLARQLGDAGLDVVVLESGEQESNSRIQALYAGKMTLGAPGCESRNLDDYLGASRVRRFGGSGNVWGGKCAPLDPIDFEKRDWIPHSGWPVTRDQMQSYYDRACNVLGLGLFGPEPRSVLGREDPVFKETSKVFGLSPRRYSPVTGAFGSEYPKFKQAAAEHARVRIYLNANVTAVRLRKNGESVEELTVRELDGREHTARAQLYILSMGGIENVRLMLASDDVHRTGIGNHSDWLGRAFQGHTTVSQNHTSVSLHCEQQDLAMFNNQDLKNPHAVLNTTGSAQRKGRNTNFTATLAGPINNAPSTTDAVVTVARRLARADARSLRGVYFMTEHTPNRDSRLTLVRDELDALGLPRIRLDMRYNELEIDSLERSIRMLAAELGRAGAGRLQWSGRRDRIVAMMGSPSRHHMGATRMSVSPRDGVVDEQCRVHGVGNLYVAGCSVFPTSGIANPTLTLLALAYRMGDHLIAARRA
jgi:choline dehydrogenase-like flavoprotein